MCPGTSVLFTQKARRFPKALRVLSRFGLTGQNCASCPPPDRLLGP